MGGGVGRGSIHWTTPDGWSEEAGSGMRLATFTIKRDDQTATCTIVTLGGMAGGLEANVHRWMGQLKLDEPASDEFAAFLARQEHFHSDSGFDGVVVDLSELSAQKGDAASMVAAILTLNDATLFVKLTGPIGLLKAEKDTFSKLCRSVRSDA